MSVSCRGERCWISTKANPVVRGHAAQQLLERLQAAGRGADGHHRTGMGDRTRVSLLHRRGTALLDRALVQVHHARSPLDAKPHCEPTVTRRLTFIQEACHWGGRERRRDENKLKETDPWLRERARPSGGVRKVLLRFAVSRGDCVDDLARPWRRRKPISSPIHPSKSSPALCPRAGACAPIPGRRPWAWLRIPSIRVRAPCAVSLTQAGDAGVCSDPIPVSPGVTFRLAARLYTPTNKQARLQILELSSANAQLASRIIGTNTGRPDITLPSPPPTNFWETVSGYFTTGPGTAEVKIRLLHDVPGTNGTTFYWDSVSLARDTAVAWERWERELTSSLDYSAGANSNPYRDLRLRATFFRATACGAPPPTCTLPNCFQQEGFWDGVQGTSSARTFRVRTALPVGDWCWQTSCSTVAAPGGTTPSCAGDAGLTQSGALKVTAYTGNQNDLPTWVSGPQGGGQLPHLRRRHHDVSPGPRTPPGRLPRATPCLPWARRPARTRGGATSKTAPRRSSPSSSWPRLPST